MVTDWKHVLLPAPWSRLVTVERFTPFNPSSALSRGTDGPPAGARPELSARSEDLGKPAQTAPSVPGESPGALPVNT